MKKLLEELVSGSDPEFQALSITANPCRSEEIEGIRKEIYNLTERGNTEKDNIECEEIDISGDTISARIVGKPKQISECIEALIECGWKWQGGSK